MRCDTEGAISITGRSCRTVRFGVMHDDGIIITRVAGTCTRGAAPAGARVQLRDAETGALHIFCPSAGWWRLHSDSTSASAAACQCVRARKRLMLGLGLPLGLGSG